jgi:hypothetical protein
MRQQLSTVVFPLQRDFAPRDRNRLATFTISTSAAAAFFIGMYAPILSYALPTCQEYSVPLNAIVGKPTIIIGAATSI